MLFTIDGEPRGKQRPRHTKAGIVYTPARDCHITCERYKEFKKELAEWYSKCHKEKVITNLAERRPWVAWAKDDDNEG